MRTQDKHDKIIKAAITVFAQKGFFNARISDIAKQAQVADGTIYLYFNNKYDILITIFEEEIDRLTLQIRERIAEEEDPRRMLYIFALEHLRMTEEKKELAELLQMELRQSNKFMKEYRNSKFIEYVDVIPDIVKKGQSLKIFRRDIDPDLTKRAFFGAIDEISRIWLLDKRPTLSIEKTASQISDIFLTGIIDNAVS